MGEANAAGAPGLDLGTLAIGIAADNSRWMQGVRQVGADVKRIDNMHPSIEPFIRPSLLQSGFHRLGAWIQGWSVRMKFIIASALGAAGLYGAYQTFGTMRRWITQASDAGETYAKYMAVFDENTKEALATAKDFSKSFGMSMESTQAMISMTGDLLSGFGFSDKQALDMSTKVNRLAADLASFSNIEGGAQRASQALTKAILGERESAKLLGIAIMEDDLKLEMLKMRKEGLIFSSERQAKAEATLRMMILQSKNAVGDYARTQDSLANAMRRIGQFFKQTTENIGTFLIDIFGIEGRVAAFGKWIEKLNDHWDGFRLKLLDVLVVFRKLVAVPWALMKNADVAVLGIADGFRVMIKWVWDNWNKLSEHWVDVLWAAAEDIFSIFSNIGKAWGGWQTNMINVAWGMIQSLMEVFKQFFSFLHVNFTQVVKRLGSVFSLLIGEMRSYLLNPLKQFNPREWLKSFEKGLERIGRATEIDISMWDYDKILKPLSDALQDVIEKPFGDGELKFELESLAKLLKDLDIPLPEFNDWSKYFTSIKGEWKSIDEWADALRKKWKEEKDAQSKGAAMTPGGDEVGIAGKITAGALQRGSQEAYAASHRPGAAQPEVETARNTKEQVKQTVRLYGAIVDMKNTIYMLGQGFYAPAPGV